MPKSAALPDTDDVNDLNERSDDNDLLYFADEEEEASFVPFKPKRSAAKRPPTMVPPADAALIDSPQNEADFHTTYTPSRHEKGWLLSSLRPFYEQDLLADVEASVKGGKEASVYRCLCSPALQASTGQTYIAAKVYRPRQFRNLRNDAVYRAGRPVLTAEGSEAKKRMPD